jgi:hypothetical protein
MIIYIDMDDVICNFTTAYKRYKIVQNLNLKIWYN